MVDFGARRRVPVLRLQLNQVRQSKALPALAFVAAYAAAEVIVYANKLVISLRMSLNMLSQRE